MMPIQPRTLTAKKISERLHPNSSRMGTEKTLAAQVRPEVRFIQPRSGVTLKIEGLQKDAYRVEYWDTTEGRVMRTEDVRLAGDDMVLSLPTFNLDIAGKVRRLE